MLDQTESACVLAGIAAVGAIYFTHSQNRFFSRYDSHHPTECSARFGATTSPEPISARAASVVSETSDKESLFEDKDLWNNMNPDDEQAMQAASAPQPNGGPFTEATKKARKEVQPTLNLETTGARTIGTRPLVAGRSDAEPNISSKPKLSGEMFFMSDAYADKLMAQSTTM